MMISGDGGRDGIPVEFILPLVPGDDVRPWRKRGKGLIGLLEAMQSEHLPKVVESARILLADGWKLRLTVLGIGCVPSRRANGRAGDHFEGEPCPWGEYFKSLGCPVFPEHTIGAGRSLPDIVDACEEAWDFVWYERSARHMLVTSDDPCYEGRAIPSPKAMGGAMEAQMRLEAKYGQEELQEACDNPFVTGLNCGKLETLRWLLGEPWGSLDT